ncbi:hypothetical protein GCM10010210_14290 [Pseudonocardia hydrocarbonoxydans]|uniref:Globin domain-containing protein n=1 Tax=Pseudonocardia hydrocarbonoxydans TaxID=76726 RepID=A0A4Y3WPC0_9PSEU|nr:hypothetical protein PHY01_24040 [Pseudonocardia hydrocarbonoxydans]
MRFEVGVVSGPGQVRPPSRAVIEAVQASCAAVAQRPVRLAEVFYANLFEMDPQLRGMFAADMTDQMQTMTDVLLGAIAQIATRDTAELEVTLQALGAAHRTRYGVQNRHYLYIGHALTRAVREVAGPAYSGALSSSWIALYQWVATHMVAGADALDAPVPAAAAEVPVPEVPVPVAVPRPREQVSPVPAGGEG